MARLSEDAQSVRPADRPTESFTTADDDDLAASLSKRLAASVDTDDSADAVPVDNDAPMTGAFSHQLRHLTALTHLHTCNVQSTLPGCTCSVELGTCTVGSIYQTSHRRLFCAAQELVDLVVAKYQNKYDMTIARRNWMGKDFVSLNIMWVHLDQRSFPMSEAEYMDKLDGISMLLNIWSKQGDVRLFLKAPAKSKNGMPPRPIVGHAVSVQLDLPPGVVSEWIGNRMG